MGGLCSLATIFSCEELIEPSLITVDPVLIVEGKVSNKPLDTRVKLSETTAFNNPEPNAGVTSASVSLVAGSNGRVTSFTETLPGQYIPTNEEFIGFPGESYTLRINLDNGESYQSNTRMPAPVPIDSITYEFDSASVGREVGYYIYYHYQDPVGKNYHLIETRRGGEPLDTDRFEIRSDENVRNKYLKLELPYVFQAEDTVQFRIKSISSEVFQYYEGINSLIESGSPSEAVPENPNNNINGDAPVLGIFQASHTLEFLVILPEK